VRPFHPELQGDITIRIVPSSCYEDGEIMIQNGIMIGHIVLLYVVRIQIF
jgi:hypothetical protein